MRRTRRRAGSAAAAALLTAATLGVATTTGSASGAPADHHRLTKKVAIQQAQRLLARHAVDARLSAGTAFKATDTMLEKSGATDVRMERSYHGLRVLGGDMVVHTAAGGGYRGISETLRKPVRVKTTPKLHARKAIRKALVRSDDTSDIQGFRSKGQPTLVVDAVEQAPRLAWAVTTGGTRTDGTPSRMTTYVDARTGAVLRREEHIETVDGSGQSLYSGTVPLNLTQSGSTYTLKDASRGGTYTTDLGNKEDSVLCQLLGSGCQAGTTFTSSTPSFGDGTTANRATVGVDAQYGTDETWDYYNQVHGRDGIFGDGTGSFNRTHYGTGYVNAFWDGTKMTYGDGDGTEYGPLVSLDVAGHEMSHGVTENTAGLTYDGESGGLNEATSDIFGTMVEFFANNPNDPGDYLIGEQFDLQHHLGLRRMDDPASDGVSANCWTTGTKDLDVHYSSGVGNHFFYLLAEGSGPKVIGGVQHDSPTCDGSTITGIGRDAAQQIWFRALTVYMTSGTDYAGARTATLSAAQDLYGAGSTQYATVAAAWSAVDVA